MSITIIDIMTLKNSINQIKFAKDVVWIALFNIFSVLTGLISLPILTKIYGAELYGLWALILAAVGLFGAILTLHLGTALIRYFSGYTKKEDLSQAFSNMFSLILILTLIVLSIVTYFKIPISSLIFSNSIYSNYVPITFLWAGSTAIFSFLIAYLRSRDKIKEISLIQILWVSFKILAMFILALLGYSLYIIIISQIIGDILFSIFIVIYSKNDLDIVLPKFNNMGGYLRFCLPQIPTEIQLWVVNSIDKYFIVFYLGLVKTGLYSVSYSLGSLLSLFYIPISFVIFPVIAELWEQGKKNEVNKYLENSIKLFLLFSIPAAMMFSILSKQIISILTSSVFQTNSFLILIIAFSTICLGIYQINSYIILLVEKTKWIPFIILLCALINVSLNLILIPVIGIMGAAVSTFFSYLVLAFIVTIWASKAVDYKFDLKFLTKIVISSIFASLFLNFFANDNILIIIIATIIGILIYFIFLTLFDTFSEKEKEFLVKIIKDVKNLSVK